MNLHQNSNIKYISANYINVISGKMNCHLKIHNIVLSSKPTTTLKSKLINFKDKVSQINHNNLIHRLDCDKICLGESSRNSRKRTNEHETNVGKHQPN